MQPSTLKAECWNDSIKNTPFEISKIKALKPDSYILPESGKNDADLGVRKRLASPCSP
jgi:hypothetical protein